MAIDGDNLKNDIELLNELTLFLGGVIYGRHVTYKKNVTYD
jgi:hypothetical protein